MVDRGMTRFDFLAPQRRSRPGSAVAVPRPLAVPFVALGLVFVALGAVCTIQVGRLAAETAAVTRAQATLDTARLRNAGVTRVLRDLETVDRRLASLRDLRRANVAQAAALATIGNRLPSGVSLRGLRVDDGTYALDGVAPSLAAVGAAADALEAAFAPAHARLVSATRTDAGITFRLTLASGS